MMNPTMNQMSFNYQSPTNFNQGVYMGGYPQGYPPDMPSWYNNGPGYNMMADPYQSPYSPFIMPPPQQSNGVASGVYVPGSVSAPEYTDKSGNTVKLPSQGYNPGGATISQGGYNPVSGMSSQVVAGNGFNPYTRFIGNPMYSAPQYQQQGVPFTPPPINQYYGQMNGGYMTPYGYGVGVGYPQNQFDAQLNDLLYCEEPSGFDVRTMLESVILTDEEREKIDHNRNYNNNFITGYDYYGRPIYQNNAYQQSQQRQSELETARSQYQQYYTHLSKVAHAYSGEEIDEEATMKRFDPCPPPPQQKMYNQYGATEEERKEFERNNRIEQCKILNQKFDDIERYQQQYDYQKAMAFAKIKESHDRLIGVEPGQHYDLKTYLDNGYKIGVNMAMTKAKEANRNGAAKYSRNDFRGALSQRTAAPVPITSKDNEYVSIEEVLKQIYDKNKQNVRNNLINPAVMQQQNGQMTYTSAACSPAEASAHLEFMKDVQSRKDKDDLRRAIIS